MADRFETLTQEADRFSDLGTSGKPSDRFSDITPADRFSGIAPQDRSTPIAVGNGRSLAGGATESFLRRTAGAVAQLPTLIEEQARFASEITAPGILVGVLDRMGVEVPDAVRKATQETQGLSLAMQVGLPGLNAVTLASDISNRIAPLKRARRALDAFAEEQVKRAAEIKIETVGERDPFFRQLISGDLEQVKEGAKTLGQDVVFEIPNLIVQAIIARLSGGASLGYMGLTAAANKYTELGGEDISPNQRLVNSTGNGIVEIFTEKIGTGRILNKSFKKQFTKGIASFFKELSIDALGGAVSEGSAQVGDNALDKLIGLDVSLGDGVGEAMLIGSVMDSGTSIAVTINTARTTSKFRRGLLAAGGSKSQVDSIIDRSRKAKTRSELNEIDKEIKDIMDSSKAEEQTDTSKEKDTISALNEKDTLSEQEREEFNDALEGVNAVDAFEAEQIRLRRDIEALSKTDPDIIIPERDSNTADLRRTADALSKLFGRDVSIDEIQDAFVEKLQRVASNEKTNKERKKQVSDLAESINLWNKGEKSTSELLDELRAINPKLVDEFNNRTTGEDAEPASQVIKDIKQKLQEAKDATKTERPKAAEAVKEGGQTTVEDTGRNKDISRADDIQRKAEDSKVTNESTEAELRAEAERLGIEFQGVQVAEDPRTGEVLKTAFFRTIIGGEKTNITPEEGETVQEALNRTKEKFGEEVVKEVQPEAKKNKEELRPFPAPETLSGVDENSSFQDIRRAFLNLGGDRKITSKSRMLKYARGKSVANLHGVEFALDVSAEIKGNTRGKPRTFSTRAFDKFIGNSFVSRLINADTFGSVLANSMPNRVRRLFVDNIRESRERAENYKMSLYNATTSLDKAHQDILDKRYKINVGGRNINIRGSRLAYFIAALRSAESAASIQRYQLDIGKNIPVRIKNLRDFVDSLPQEVQEAGNAFADMWFPLAQDMGVNVKRMFDLQQIRMGNTTKFDALENYLPQKLAVDGKDEELFDENGKPVENNAFNRTIYSQGWFKNRKNLGKPTSVMIIPDVYDMMFKHINDASLFVGMAPVITELNQTVNESASDIRMRYGRNFEKQLKDSVSRVQGVKARHEESRVLNEILKRETTLHLSRPSTMLRMGSSLFLTIPYLKNPSIAFTYAFKPKSKAVRNKISEEMNKSGILVSRYTTGATPELAESGARSFMRGITRNGVFNFTKPLISEAARKAKNLKSVGEGIRTLIPSAGDLSAIRSEFEQAIADELSDEGVMIKDMDAQIMGRDEEFWNRVRSRTEDLTAQTQPSNFDEHRSAIHGSGRSLAMRLLTRYGTQMNKIFNNVVQEANNAINTGDGKKFSSVVVTSFIVMSVVNTIIARGTKEAYKLWREAFGLEPKDDEDEESFMQEFGIQLERMSLSVVEGGDEIFRLMDHVRKKLKGEFSFGARVLPLGDTFIEATANFASGTRNIAKRSKAIENRFTVTKDGRRQRLTAKGIEQQKELLAKDVSRTISSALTLFGGMKNIPTPFIEQAFGSREAFEKIVKEYYEVE